MKLIYINLMSSNQIYFGVMDFVLDETQTVEISSRFEEEFENLFSRILYLGPLREHPRHHYTWEGDHPKGIGQEGEKAISALLSGRIRRFPIDEQILKLVTADWN